MRRSLAALLLTLVVTSGLAFDSHSPGCPALLALDLLRPQSFGFDLVVALLMQLSFALLAAQVQGATEREMNEGLVRGRDDGAEEELRGVFKAARVQGRLTAFEQGGRVVRRHREQLIEKLRRLGKLPEAAPIVREQHSDLLISRLPLSKNFEVLHGFTRVVIFERRGKL